MASPRRPLLRLCTAFALTATGLAVTVPSSPVAAEGTFEALASPQRIADTRPNGDTADGEVEKTGLVRGGATLVLQVAGRAGVPVDADSAVLNVTVANTASRGFLTIYPCGEEQPNAANLNYAQGQVIANAVFAKLDDEGNTCIFTSATTNLIVDATGSLPTGSFEALPSPQRIVDTRPTGETVDEELQKSGPNPAGEALEVQVAGRAGIADDAATAVLNVTVIGPSNRGFVTLYPCDQPQPLSANLNFSTGDVVANSVIAKLDATGKTCVFTSAATNVVVDVSGSLPDTTFTPLAAPQRIVETRVGEKTADGIAEGIEYRRAGLTLQLPIAGRVDIPEDASAVILNVTALGSSSNGFVTAHPRNSTQPNAANLNYAPGQVIANTVVAKLGGRGEICMFTSSDVEVIVDVAGYLIGEAPVDSGVGCPLEIQPISDSERKEYPVGQFQVPPGRYVKTETPTGFCDIERREAPPADRESDFRDTVAANSTFFGKQLFIDVLATDVYLAFEGGEDCGPLLPYVAPTTPPTSFPATIGPGQYMVGDDIAPGTYSTVVEFGQICIAGRVQHWQGFFGGVGVNDMELERVDRRSEGPLSLTVRPGDFGARFGNCIWTLS